MAECTRKCVGVDAIGASVTGSCDGSKSKLLAIFFDLDNTLIPTRSGDSKACRKLSEKLENQYAFAKEEAAVATQAFLKSFRRCPDNSQTSLDSWRTYLWREALSNRHKHLAEQIYLQWLQLRYRYLALQPEYIQMLRCLRETGLLLALITNGPSNAQWEKIKKLKLSQYFDCILVSSDLPWEKPNPNIFYAACNFLGVKPRECAMIGDKLETDVKGGRLAKLGATFWVPLSSQSDNDLTDVTYPPDYILRNILELNKYFPGLNGCGASSSNSSNNGNNNCGTGAVTPSTSGAGGNASAVTRRCNQISRSTTTSTCDSDHLFSLEEQYKQHLNSFVSQTQAAQHEERNSSGCAKNRRGGSLPTIEYFNSEAENSSDSLFN